MEEITNEQQNSRAEQVKSWLQDNLRIVVSIAIVVAIAGGIYSYSQRGVAPIVKEKEKVAQIDEQAAQTDEEKATEEKTASSEAAKAAPESKQVVPTTESKETESSFVETAAKGEGLTHLGRRALANYLEKNPDSSLTKEHKIYIEDYLRKQVKQSKGVKVGVSVEFSKSQINAAIEKSKQLNDKQLQNLKKYSARVASL